MNSLTPKTTIAARRASILDRLAVIAKESNRPAPTLVAVSKVQPDARIKAMLDTGHTVFGENRVQEAAAHWQDSFAKQRSGLILHLIGPLQTNKAADAVALFDVIETLDREKLARYIADAAQKQGSCPKLFIQVNTGEEPQKAGVLPAELDAFVSSVRKDYGLTPAGLMCIPPAGEASSPHFVMLSHMAARNGLDALSMGMSGDYETAAALGATHVRIGSALFGARDTARSDSKNG